MYAMLEDLRIDLGIPSDKESAGNAFGGDDYGKDTITKTKDTEFNRDTVLSTLTHVTPLEQDTLSNTRNTNLNDYRDDGLHAFKPISSNDVLSDTVDHSVKSNTPAFSEVHTQSRKSSYHSDQQENYFGTLKSTTPTLSDVRTSRKNSEQGHLHSQEINSKDNPPSDEVYDDRASEVLSDVAAESPRQSLEKTTRKFDNTNHVQNDSDGEEGYDDVDTVRKTDHNDEDNNKHEAHDDYETKYDDDDYELETGRTNNEDDDYDTIRSNYEKIEGESVSDRSENDVYGQSEIESTKVMKTTTKSDDD